MVPLSAIVRLFRQIGVPLGILCIMLSCTDRVPTGIIPPEEMTNVLFDVHVADGMLANQPIDSARVKMISLYAAIFDRHGIDSTVLRNSVEYYTAHPLLMKEMYTEIEARMNGLVEAELAANNERYRLERQADSIRAARVTDSLRRVERLRKDVERKRHLLFVPVGDTSVVDAAIPVTPQTLRDRLHEEIGLGELYIAALRSAMVEARGIVAPIDATEMPVQDTPAPPSTPEEVNPSPRRLLVPEEISP